jgi:hypothetical protein
VTRSREHPIPKERQPIVRCSLKHLIPLFTLRREYVITVFGPDGSNIPTSILLGSRTFGGLLASDVTAPIRLEGDGRERSMSEQIQIASSKRFEFEPATRSDVPATVHVIKP